MRGKGKLSSASSIPRIPLARKILYAFVATFLVLAGVEVVLFIAGVEPIASREDPFVGFSSHYPLFRECKAENGMVILATATNKLPFFNYQEFPKKKAPRTFRVFCLGGSTTFGSPFGENVSFCGWLRALLPVADPSRNWEVINAGGISYASYRVRVVMEELVRYQPDLFIIYSGHNEFLERRTYGEARARSTSALGPLYELPYRSRTMGLLARALGKFQRSTKAVPGKPILPAEVVTMLDESVGPSAYTWDDSQREKTVGHFRYNLERMIDTARANGTEVILVTPASNLKFSPFKSENTQSLTGTQREHWNALYQRGLEGQGEEALNALREAEAIDDRHAGLHYSKGQILYELGRYANAKSSFMRARDEDVCPLRALSSMVEIVREVATAKKAALSDFVKLMEQYSDHGITDSAYFVDHVHPTVEGNLVLARSLIDKMNSMNLLECSSSWNEQCINAKVREVKGGIDKRQQARALKHLSKLMGWAGKMDEAYGMACRSLQLYDGDGETYYLVGKGLHSLGRQGEAAGFYRKALDLNPELLDARGSLGMLLSAQGNQKEAIECLSEVVRLRPDDWRAHEALGTAYIKMGNLDRAKDHASKALEINDKSVRSLYNMGLVWEGKGRADKALACYNQSLRLKPDWRAPAERIAVIQSRSRAKE